MATHMFVQWLSLEKGVVIVLMLVTQPRLFTVNKNTQVVLYCVCTISVDVGLFV